MNQKLFQRIGAALCTTALCLSLLTGCGVKQQANGEPGSNGESTSQTPGTNQSSQSGQNGNTRPADTPEFVYVPSFTKLNAQVEYINMVVPAEDKIYFTSGVSESVDPDGNVLSETDEQYWDYYTYRTAIFCMNQDGSDLHELDHYKASELPEGKMGSVDINSLTVDGAGNLAVVENVYSYHFDAPEGMTEEDEEYWNYYVDDGNKSILRIIDTEGNELSSTDLSNLSDEENFYISSMIFDEAGNLYLNTGNAVHVLSAAGEKLFTVTVDNWISSLVLLGNGSVAASGYGTSGFILHQIDLSAKAWGKEIKLPMNVNNVYSGGGEYLAFAGDGNNLYGYNESKDEWSKILNWIDSDVDGSNLSAIIPTDDGRIVALSQTWGETGMKLELVNMIKTPWDQVPHKTVLTYACVYLDWNLRSQIIEFNRTNPDFRISVKDYSEYNTEEDYTAGMTKLTTEIVSGNVPDLIATNSMPIDQYAAKGLLEDLYPFMDADPEVTRASFVPSVLHALESDGKLYMIGNTFSIQTVVGDPRIIGSEPGWTLDELNDAMQKLGPDADVFDQYITRDAILQQALCFSMDEFVDWSTGKCSFDSEGFVKLLEFCNRFPAEYNWDNYEYSEEDSTPNRIRSGKQLLVNTGFSDFDSFQMYKAMFGGDIVIKGFPCESKNGTALSMYSGIAMTTSCQNKQGAWSFIRSMLTEDYQKENVQWNFPTNQAAFDAMLETAMTPQYETDPETGETREVPKNSYGYDTMEVEIYALSQEEADQIVGAINSVSQLYSYDQSVYNIISDEAAAFFNGQRSARDCANYIQSRVNLYVNEQR